jgi:ppGpp synthetase/RelA/SpoT-type nucleotidyltranferase
MITVVPAFSRKAVNRAGEILISDHTQVPEDELFWAMDVLSNWRACHSYPINTFQATLRKKIADITPQSTIVAQRLKRTPSIVAKLQRFDGMQLARMQDIGGLRAVMPGIPSVRKLHAAYVKNEGRFTHTFGAYRDYIDSPKPDGYRGLHQVFKYKNPLAPSYDGLHLELQIRTRLQHAWATAVETMGTFLNQALKSGHGDELYRDYFKLCSAAFAKVENCASVPGYEAMSAQAINKALLDAEWDLQVCNMLQGFSVAAKNIEAPTNGNAAYYLVILNIQTRRLRIRPFARRHLDEATAAYIDAEREAQSGAPLEVVLVAAGSIKNLKKAYPNYFLDTNSFVQTVRKLMESVF